MPCFRRLFAYLSSGADTHNHSHPNIAAAFKLVGRLEGAQHNPVIAASQPLQPLSMDRKRTVHQLDTPFSAVEW